MAGKPTILYCNCSWKNLIPEERKRKAREVVGGVGSKVVAVPDLCAMAARRDPHLAILAAKPGLTVVACYPRAVRWLFHWAECPLDNQVEILNLRTSTIRDLADRLAGGTEVARPREAIPDDAVAVTGEWIPWFPIIDYDKCTNCKQCLSFCPFGVYSQSDDGKVIVTRPENCKNNCPACARVCPSVAIMFPKLIDSPINGADVRRQDIENAKHRLEEQKLELAQKGIHSVLARRKLRALARRMAEQHAREAMEEPS